MMSNDVASTRRVLCRPMPDQKGQVFEEWNKELLDAAGGEGDEDASWADRFLGLDPRVGLTAAQQRRRQEGNRKAVSNLLAVIPNKALKAVIRVDAVNRPNPGPGMRTDARIAYQTLQREMSVPDSSGRVQRKLDAFNAIRIKSHVGVSEDSLAILNRKYTADNIELPQGNRFSTDMIVEKLLAAITFPAALAAEADKMLGTDKQHMSPQFYDQPVAAMGVMPPVPGGWRRDDVVSYFDELWRSAWKRQDPELKFATASLSADRVGPSARADGMHANAMHADDHAFVADSGASVHMLAGQQRDLFDAAYEATTEYLDEDPTQLDDANVAVVRIASIFSTIEDANAAQATAEAYVQSLSEDVAHAAMDKLSSELVCYKCFGNGHRAADCASGDDPARTPAILIPMLRALETRSTARRPSFARPFQRGGGRGRGGRGGRGLTMRGGSRSSATGVTGGRFGRGGRGLPLFAQTRDEAHPAQEPAPEAADRDQAANAQDDQNAEDDHATPALSRGMDAGGDDISQDDDLFSADEAWQIPPPSFKQRFSNGAKMAGGAMLLSLFAVAGVAMAVNRRMLPTPTRLATMLILAGAQTGQALSPAMPVGAFQGAVTHNGVGYRLAAMGIAGGALIKEMANSQRSVLRPTDIALPSLMVSGLLDHSIDRAKMPTNGPDSFLVDCGATAHMVPTKTMLTRITQLNPDRSVRVANNAVLPANAVGEIDLPVKGRMRFKSNKTRLVTTLMTLSGVLAVPGLTQPLFSCYAAFEDDGIETHLNGTRKLMLPSGVEVPFASGTGKRYVVRGDREYAALAGAEISDDVHAYLGHFSADRIALARARSKGLVLPPTIRADLLHASDCPSCGLGGATRPSHSKKRKVPPDKLEGCFGDRVSVDVCGPFPRSVHTGFKYVVGFADRETKVTAVYFMADKTAESVKNAMKTFVADHVHLLPQGRVKEFHTDNGGEFVSASVDEMLNEMMTRRSLSVPFTPQRNGQIERFFYTLVRHTRILCAASGHSEVLWPFAMSHVVSIHNRLPTRTLPQNMSPNEAATGKMPNLGIFNKRVWGCDCIVRQRDEDLENKLSLTGVASVFLGRDERRHGEYHFITSLNKVVSVVEAYKYYPKSFTPIHLAPAPKVVIDEPRDKPPVQLIGNFQSAVAVPTNYNAQLPTVQAIPMPNRAPTDNTNVAELVTGVHAGSTVFGSSLIGDTYAVALAAVASNGPPPPVKHTDIYGRPDEAEWLQSEVDDIVAKMENGAFVITKKTNIPRGRRLVRSKFAYANKPDPVTNDLMERRARFIACGCSQGPGDYDETTCGTMRGPSVRALMATAAIDDCDLFLGDVIKAFTQAKLDKEIYVEIPAQFNMPDMCFKAMMSLEGLKQSGNLFQNDAYAQLRKQGGVPSETDPNIWFIGKGKDRITIGMWVDDMLILTPKGRRDLADKFWTGFRSRFNCKDLVVPAKFVGLEITRNRAARTITLRQSTYIDGMFDKYMSGDSTKVRKLPVGRDEALLKAFMEIKPGEGGEAATVLTKEYMGLIGSLLYAAGMTRPDIAFHVSFLAKMMQNPSEEALDAARGILGYLKHTRDLGITYGPSEDLEMCSDSSFGREPRPMAGFACFYGGAALSWQAKSLKLVPLSSAEAEANVLSLGCKDAVYIRRLLTELRPGKIKSCIATFTDNQAAIDIIKAHGLTARTKHFERWASYIRDLYQRHIVSVDFKPTDMMPADIFTKALPEEPFKLFRSIVLGHRVKM